MTRTGEPERLRVSARVTGVRRRFLPAPPALAVLALWSASAACGIDSECAGNEEFCSGDYLVVCDSAWSDSSAPRVWRVGNCAGGEYPGACRMVDDEHAECVMLPMAERPDEDKPIRWVTDRAVLGADAIEIDALGVSFSPAGAELTIDGDGPSDHSFTDRATLEVQWEERGVPMRLYFYFVRDDTHWWCDRMATYNGLAYPDNDTLEYVGEFFRTPLGEWYRGEVDLTSDLPPSGGALRIRGLQLRAFR